MPPVALDENLQIALAEALERSGVDVVHISRWRGQNLRTFGDDIILAATTAAGRVLISRDANTLPKLAYDWINEGRHHTGLIILPNSISQHDIGGARDAILHVIRDANSEALANQVIYAQRQR
jgi:hypothetical protein